MAASIWRRADLPGLLRWRRPWTVGAAGTIALGLVGLGFVSSPLFQARTIVIRGEHRLRAAHVVRLAGIGPGTNVLWLDAGDVVRRLESNPWIASAVVAKTLPSTVRIEIEERTAVGVVQMGPTLEIVAGDGSRLGSAASDPGLPVIVVSPSTDAAPDAAALAAAARALQPMAGAVRATIQEVAVLPDGTLRFRLATGTQVTYGPATQVNQKAAALASLLKWASAQGSSLAAVDLTSPGAPTARLGTPPA